MGDEREARKLLTEREPTPAEIALDILIACINKSNSYDPKVINEANSRNQVTLITSAYVKIFEAVNECSNDKGN